MLTIESLFFSLVHVHSASPTWLRPCAQPAQAQLPQPAHRGGRAGLPARREEVDRGCGGAVVEGPGAVEGAEARGEAERGGGG